jgi:hypothetical protein
MMKEMKLYLEKMLGIWRRALLNDAMNI